MVDEIEKFYESFEGGIPYTEALVNGYYYRFFFPDIDAHLLKWHWDDEDRYIIPLNANDWKFQFDNELPIDFNIPIFIKEGIQHRIIKGTTSLFIKIKKYGTDSTGIST